MRNPLLDFILKELEAFPAATFSEAELIRISKPDFPIIQKAKLLKFVQSDPEREPFYSQVQGDSGNERFVKKVNGIYRAFSTEDDEIPPIDLKREDITRWSFDIVAFGDLIKKDNQLAKSANQVTSRIYFLGEKEVIGSIVGVFVALLTGDDQAKAELLALKNRIASYDICLVLCPNYHIASQDLLNKLSVLGIGCLPFKDAFKGQNYKIDFKSVMPKKAKVQTGRELSQKQIDDCRQYSYLCKDSIHLPGLQSKPRSNQVEINGIKVKIGDSLFALLLRFVVAAKKNKKKGGWENPGFAPGKHQPSSNLRTAIQGSLAGKDGQKFIESDGSKQYRISTHPDFVTYDRAKLLRHPLSSVKVLAKKLPK